MAIELLAKVGIPTPTARDQYLRVLRRMRQRGMIAMAISCNPTSSWPTSPPRRSTLHPGADHGRHPRDATGLPHGVIMITHDLGVVAQMADKVMVMYGGRTLEDGPVDEVYYNPHSPTRGACWARCRASTRTRSSGSRRSKASRRTCCCCPTAARSRALPLRAAVCAGEFPRSRWSGPVTACTADPRRRAFQDPRRPASLSRQAAS